MTRSWDLCKKLPVLCVLLIAAPARAEEVPSFRKRSALDKKFVSEVCVAILKAAHFSGRNPALEKYELKEVKPGRADLHVRGTYHGTLTNRTYTAEIVVVLDTANKGAWEVLRIEYSDNNRIGHSRKKVDALVEKFNAR